MPLLIRAVTIIDPASKFHSQTKDILIKDGKIASVKHRIDAGKDDEIFEAENLFLSPGWCDLCAYLCDPGYEYKEDLQSGLKAAAYGGFTAVAVMPNTLPVTDNQSQIAYLLNKTRNNVVDLLPVGAVTKNMEGKTLAELYDMSSTGAVAFSDAQHPIADAGLMMRGLLYVKDLHKIILSNPHDDSLAPGGQMNEGEMSIRLGMAGIPALAEDLMVVRDIELAEYTGSHVHFTCISTKEAVDRIREAKRKKIPVTAGVNAVHLFADETMVEDFDSNWKIFPPLRTQQDIAALKEGLKDGTIDVICSAHKPENEERKKLEFEYASSGIINLQTCYSIAGMALKDVLTMEEMIQKISVNPRTLLRINVPHIEENAVANFTIFDPQATYTFEESMIQSKSKNSPFIGKKLNRQTRGNFQSPAIPKTLTMNPTKSAWPLAIKYGLITAIASFVYSIILYITHLYTNAWLPYVGLIIMLIGLTMGIRERRDKELNGYISYGGAFGTGMMISLVIALISIVTTFLMFSVIAPDEIGEMAKMQQQALEAKGMSQDQIQQGMDIAKKFMTPTWFVIWGIVGILFFGCIINLILAAILKKDNPNFPGSVSAEAVS